MPRVSDRDLTRGIHYMGSYHMIVKELMGILEKFDPDTEVIASSNVDLGRPATGDPNEMDAEWYNITGHYDLGEDLMDENGEPEKLLALYIDIQ